MGLVGALLLQRCRLQTEQKNNFREPLPACDNPWANSIDDLPLNELRNLPSDSGYSSMLASNLPSDSGYSSRLASNLPSDPSFGGQDLVSNHGPKWYYYCRDC